MRLPRVLPRVALATLILGTLAALILPRILPDTASSEPIYSVAAVDALLNAPPRAWDGRIIRVRGVAFPDSSAACATSTTCPDDIELLDARDPTVISLAATAP